MDARIPSQFAPHDVRAAHSHRIRALRQAAVLREIEQRCVDPELRAASVAAQLGITARYVHLLLKETGRTFSRHVLDKRLEQALALLRDPQWHSRKIADVAGESGFADLSYFSRTFRRKYGDTPSAVREIARRG